jgi:hypothetical protein
LLDFAAPAPVHRCELCARELGDDHDHVLSKRDARLACACRPCALLLGSDTGTLSRVDTRIDRLSANVAPDIQRRLHIPVGLAGIVHEPNGRVHALYPGPLGVVEADVSADAWRRLVADWPELHLGNSGTNAVLIHRTEDSDVAFRVSVDIVYAIVGLLRRHRTKNTDLVTEFIDEIAAGRAIAQIAEAP